MSRDPNALGHPGPPADGTGDPEFPPVRREKADPFLAVLLALMSLLPAAPYLLFSQTILGFYPFSRDENLAEWMIYRRFIADRLAAGSLPTWLPWLNAGMPFAAWPHASAFSPSNLIYLILPYNPAAVIGLFFHLAVFSVGLYVLLRLLSRRPFGAWLGAVVGLGLFALTHADHFVPRLFTFSWTPLLFACYVGLWRTRRWSWFMMASGLFGVQVLGGHVEYIVRQFIFIGLAGVGVLIFRPRALLERRGAALAIAVSVAVGLALAAIQLVPTAELVHLTIRSSPDWFSYREFSRTAGPDQLILLRFILFAPVILAFFLAVTRPGASVGLRVAAVIAAGTGIFCLNLFGSLRLLYPLPIIGRMMWHHLGLNFLVIPLALVVALAAERALETESRRRLVLLLSIFCWLDFGLRAYESRFPPFSQGHYPLAEFLDFQDQAGPALALIAVAASILFLRRAPSRLQTGAYLAALMLFCYYLPVFFMLHREPNDWPRYNPAYLQFLSRPRPPGRILTYAPPSQDPMRSIPFQVGGLPGEQAIDSTITSPIIWYAEFYSLIAPLRQRSADGWITLRDFWTMKRDNYVSEKNPRLLNLLNLTHLVTEETNLRSASHYNLAYYFDPAAVSGRGGRRIETPGPATVSLLAPSAWKSLVHLPSAGDLSFEATAPAGAALELLIAPAPGPVRLAYHRAFGPGTHPAAPVSIDLAPWRGLSVNLEFAILDHRPGPDRGGAIARPVIHLPDAYFQREELEGLDVFDNPGALPRAVVVHAFRSIPEREARLSFLGSSEFNPAVEVVLETSVAGAASGGTRRPYTPARVVGADPDRFEVEFESPAPGFLVWSEVYYPGWRAWLDGTETRIERADHAFRAVGVPAGRNWVKFIYQPISFRVGLFSAAASVMAFSLSLLLGVRKRRSNPE